MKIEHPYSIGKQEAYRRVDRLLDELQRRHSSYISEPSRSWNPDQDRMDFSLKIKGFSVTGQVALYENRLVLDGKVPLLARPFGGLIESTIKGQLESLLD